MQKACISGIGGYLPLLRLDRKTAARNYAWSGLAIPRKGTRAVADWDEDPVTMAAESARALVATAPAALRFASTSSYFSDRSQAGIVLDYLALPRSVRTTDAANARRAGTSALLDSLLGGADELVTAAEKRVTQAGSAAQLAYGDGAAAVRTGAEGAARLIGHASISHDLVDRYVSRDQPYPYAYEERFIRDIAVAEMFIPAIRAACEAAGIEGSAIAQAACAEPAGGCWRAATKKLGIAAPNHCERLSDEAGDLGAAHALYGLGLAFAEAKPGDIVLLAGFGSGVDVLLFEVTGAVPGAAAMAEGLAEGRLLGDFLRFLNLSGSVDLDWGMRAEFGLKAQASMMERVGRDITGFIGGRDSHGNVQFPKSAIPVNPAASGPEAYDDVRLAEDQARIVSVTADRLTYHPDPPLDYGLVQFDNGARLLMEMVNRPDNGFAVGDRVMMRPRIKSQNRALGFRTYFWKAAPLSRPVLGDN